MRDKPRNEYFSLPDRALSIEKLGDEIIKHGWTWILR